MDSLQVVREKSLRRVNADRSGDKGGGEKSNEGVGEGCVCIHLPVMKVNDTTHQNNNNKADNNDATLDNDNNNEQQVDDLNNTISAYNTEFNQPQHIQHKMYLSERNVMRSPSEGKANLDRYRLASARIFGLIDDTLGELLATTSCSVEDNGGGGDKRS
eukprot:scaffold45958_cov234-Skeletonema_marinoi.AAC.3